MADQNAVSTYGVTWYVEVDAEDAIEAEAKARMFLAPKYRKNWAPLDVDEIDPEVESILGTRIKRGQS